MADSRHALMLLAIVAFAAAAVEEQKLLIPPGTLEPGRMAACWRSVLGIPSCYGEFMRSFLTFRIQLGPDCCKVVDEVGNSCYFLDIIFSDAPVNPFFPPAVQDFCRKITTSSPPAA